MEVLDQLQQKQVAVEAAAELVSMVDPVDLRVVMLLQVVVLVAVVLTLVTKIAIVTGKQT